MAYLPTRQDHGNFPSDHLPVGQSALSRDLRFVVMISFFAECHTQSVTLSFATWATCCPRRVLLWPSLFRSRLRRGLGFISPLFNLTLGASYRTVHLTLCWLCIHDVTPFLRFDYGRGFWTGLTLVEQHDDPVEKCCFPKVTELLLRWDSQVKVQCQTVPNSPVLAYSARNHASVS
jgi:hypothetical protein